MINEFTVSMGDLPDTVRTPRTPGAPVTVLCGSMRFATAMTEVAAELTVLGHIVLPPFVVIPPGQQVGNETKQALDQLHRHKIDLSDLVVIVTDIAGYIGESTTREIEYAHATGKPVIYTHRTTSTPTSPAKDA